MIAHLSALARVIRRAPLVIRPTIAGTLAIVAACNAPEHAANGPPMGALNIATTDRVTLRVIGADTLSDSARIVRIVTEPDGDAIALLFSDPAKHVTSGLAIVDTQHVGAHLVWPDSVTQIAWPAPHRLVFRSATGNGVLAVGDVHADTLRAITSPADTLGRPSTSTSSSVGTDASARARAVAILDFLHLQSVGGLRGATLRYQPTALLRAPADSVVAFYAVASDSAGRRQNPFWYILDLRNGRAVAIDSVVGAAEDLPESAGAWRDGGHFVFGRMNLLREASLTRK